MTTDLYTRQKSDSKKANYLRNVLAALVNLKTQLDSFPDGKFELHGLISVTWQISWIEYLIAKERGKKQKSRIGKPS